ncbi:MAG: CPBP family intramembrane metalloprotease [Clostridiales bacterium]|nr:CPBP family intramembrane metalloprotease [Clostridiales bacterium]
MNEFSLSRRIWRVIYPAILYVLISTVITVIGAFIYVLIFISSDMSANAGFDISGIMETAMQSIMRDALLILLLGYIAALAVFIPIWLKTKGRYPRWNGGKFSVPVALCSAGVAIGLNIVLSAVITFTGLAEMFETYESVVDVVSGGSLAVQIIAVGFIGPIAEELCFRGVTLSRMANGSVWLAVVIQAVLFGIVHLNILQGSYAALLGVFLGFLTVRYRSIVYALIAHIAFNLYTVLLSAVESQVLLGVIVIALAAAAVVSVVGLYKSKKPEPYVEPEIKYEVITPESDDSPVT